MIDYTKIIRELIVQQDIQGAVSRIQQWLEADADDMGVWLAVMDALDHERMRKPKTRQFFVGAMSKLVEWISLEELAWDVALVLGQALEIDDPQSATSLWVRFVQRFPAHEGGLDHLVDLVLNDGDYRQASWALDDLAREQPALAPRFLLALGVLNVGNDVWERARENFKRSGQSNAAIREALARYDFPEEELPDWLLSE